MRFLDFPEIDSIARAAARSRPLDLPARAFVLHRLGPAVELFHLCADRAVPPLAELDWLDSGRWERVVHFMTAEASGFFAADEAATILKGKAIADEVALQRFYLEAHKKGLACGYPSRLVAQFIAAVGELLGNVIEHSNAAQTGTAWIRCTPREFEFGISDHGVGPRASLLSGPAGLQPKSDTEALTMMLTDGVSRYGIDQGRGRGFRPIFVGLSNLAGYMRFRSGSGSLTVQGTISPDIAATPAQKPHVEGLLLSVLCRAA